MSEEDHKRAKAEEDARWERFQFSARRPVRSGFRFAYKNYSGTLDTSFSERMHFSSLSKYVALEFYAAAVNLPATVRFEEHFPDIDFPESVSENPLRNSFIPGELKRFFENRAIFTWWDLVQIPLQERINQIDHPELKNLREKWRSSGLRAISSPYYFSLFEYLDIPIEELEMNRLWVPLKEAREKLSAFTIEIFEQ